MRTTMIVLRSEWRRRWDFNGSPRKLLIAAASIAALDIIGILAERFMIVEQFYGAHYIGLVAIIASRLGVRSALLATALGALSCNYLFQGAPPHDGFNWPSNAEWQIYVIMFVVAVAVAGVRTPGRTRVFDRGPNLPFTRSNNGPDGKGDDRGLHGSGWIFWDVQRSGRWKDDLPVGSEYVRIWADRAMSGESYPRLAWIVHDMIKSGRWSGVEAAFASGLERLALRRPEPAAPEEPPRRSPDSQ